MRADLAILNVGAAIRATTAGRIPLKMRSTVSTCWNWRKNRAIISMMINEGSTVPNAIQKAPQNFRNL